MGKLDFVFPRIERPLGEVGSGDLPGNVVESGAGIAKAISNNRTKARVGIPHDLGVYSPSASVILDGCDSVHVSLQIPENFAFEHAQMFLCPDDFEPCSV